MTLFGNSNATKAERLRRLHKATEEAARRLPDGGSTETRSLARRYAITRREVQRARGKLNEAVVRCSANGLTGRATFGSPDVALLDRQWNEAVAEASELAGQLEAYAPAGEDRAQVLARAIAYARTDAALLSAQTDAMTVELDRAEAANTNTQPTRGLFA